MIILAVIAVVLGMASAVAQQIAVVSGSGSTSIYQTFEAAINGAEPGSVIYLPGGGFPLPDSVKITKKLTIIGIGHKSTNDNVDGYTTIPGNVFFNEGSSGSGIMGCLITGNVCIGHDDASVNNILVKCCNVNAIDSRVNCENIVISQNYIRNPSPICGCGSVVTNNILHSLYDMNSSTICYNIITSAYSWKYLWSSTMYNVDNTNIHNNIIFNTGADGPSYACDNIQANRNMFININWGDNCVNLTDCSWEDIFVNYNGGAINPMSDFHFKAAYLQYSDIGIYGGSGFNDHQTAPVPYIVAKRIAEQTDAEGKLKVQIRVNAGPSN